MRVDLGGMALVACPGSEHFASLIDRYLCRHFQSWVHHEVKQAVKGRTTKEENFSFITPCYFTRFANGEFKTEVMESLRGKHVFIIQDVANQHPLVFPGDPSPHVLSINDHLFNLYVTIDAVRTCSPQQITLILPTFPYSRQHQRKRREGLTASLFGFTVEALGVARIITLDIHSKEIENTFRRLLLEDLHAAYQILRKFFSIRPHIRRDELMIIAPDAGAIGRNKFFAEALGCPLGLLYKDRDYSKLSLNAATNNIRSIHLVGEVNDKVVFLNDDILGTGGTLVSAIRILKEAGAREIIASVSLPMFNGNAVEYFEKAHHDGVLSVLIGTNAVTVPDSVRNSSWYHEADVSRLFGRVIACTYANRSVSHLLDDRHVIHRLLKEYDFQ